LHWALKKQTWRLVLLVAMPVIIAYFLWSVRAVLLPFVLATLLAYLLSPLVEMLEQRGLSRRLAIVVVYTTLLSICGVTVFYGFPRLLRELTGLNEAIPLYLSKFEEIMFSLQQNYSSFDLPDSVRTVIDQRLSGVESIILRLVNQSVDILVNLCSQVLSFLLAPVLAFYILKDQDGIRSGLESLIPRKIKGDVLDLARDTNLIIRKFIRGHLLLCTMVGGLTALGMYLIGMPFALLIGIIAGLAELIPFFGPLLGAIPALAIGILQSWQLTIYALLVFLVVQQIENNVISPKILGEALGLHPIVIIFSLLAGGQLWGVIGMLVALPLAAILRLVIGYIFLKLVE
jgi:predicted PurR-regulated permease PerM